MSDYNSKNNRFVWADIPVADLDRAIAFYAAVGRFDVSRQEMPGGAFGVFHHEDGNGGCLIEQKAEVTGTQGVLVYLNVDGRIRDALAQVTARGGKVVEPIHGIGPHGFRAVILDSEGNRLALHSQTDR